jgi:hypothetical protein
MDRRTPVEESIANTTVALDLLGKYEHQKTTSISRSSPRCLDVYWC